MNARTFDAKLVLVFSIMGLLAVLVSFAAIAVTRYLISAQTDLVERTAPALEMASRVGAEAENAGALAIAFLQADTREASDRLASSLMQSVGTISDGLEALGRPYPSGSPATDTPSVAALVESLSHQAAGKFSLAARIAAGSVGPTGSGARLDALVEAQTDLARLRVTAGIADIHAQPGTEVRPRLDALADRDFFAFERLTELARATDALRRDLGAIDSLRNAGDLAAARHRIEAALGLMERRVGFLPTPSGRTEAESILSELEDALLGRDGLLDLRQQQLDLDATLADLAILLRRQVADLAEVAREIGADARAAGVDRLGRTQDLSRQISTGLLVLILAAGLAGTAVWLHARRVIIVRLRTVSDRIVGVADGDYREPVAISGDDEIGQMERSLEVLRERAAEAAGLRDRLEEAVIARTGDVVREMQASDAARGKAEAANRAKSDLLARLSHEIRTPLNGIIGMLALIDEADTGPDRAERLRIALSSAHGLRDLTNDILTFSGSEVRADSLRPVHFNLRELVGGLGHQLASEAASKDLRAAVDLREPAPQVLRGDVVKIRQVLNNLLSNAVKYTERGTVSLLVDHAPLDDGDRVAVSFTVEDTGLGMSEALSRRAFDIYARGEEAIGTGREGIGLGLAISRQLTEALGGVLSVESEPGIGSRFTLTVPLDLGDPALVARNEDPLPEQAFDLSVLVIEDDAVNRMVARGYLERMGCRVDEAADGASGIAAACDGAHDLILLDLGLPDMAGEDVARRIAALPGTGHLVALTARVIGDSATERDRIGVDRILAKPLSPRALAGLLEELRCVRDDPDREAVAAGIREDVADLGPEATARIVSEFLRGLPGDIARLCMAPPQERRRLAHRMRGAASNFRLTRLCAVLAVMEANEGKHLPEALREDAESAARQAVQSLEAAAAASGLEIDAGSTKR